MDHSGDNGSGRTAAQIFGAGHGLTFDDLLLVPGFVSDCGVEPVLQSEIATGFFLNVPLVSSPMDTVTEWKTAVQMALCGGIGIIHGSLDPAVQVEHVRRVKRFQMGIITDPRCCKPDAPARLVVETKQSHGFSTLLVTEDGTSRSRLQGMVTSGHAVLRGNLDLPMSSIWIPRDKLTVVDEAKVRGLRDAIEALKQHPQAPKLPIVRKDGSVAGLITRKDVVKIEEHPVALVDDNEQLCVGAAISTHSHDLKRAADLIAAGVDILVVDSSQGGTRHVEQRLRDVLAIDSKMPIVVGNVVSPDAAEPLIKAGARGLRVGVGSGSICTTQQIMAVGRAQLSAVYHVAKYCAGLQKPIPVIADGGVRSTGDIILALLCGASCVMMGRMIAGCDETPAPEESRGGQRGKRYRGMGSREAMQEGGRYRYGAEADLGTVIPQGVTGWVPVQGAMGPYLQIMAATARKFMSDFGIRSIRDMHKLVDKGRLRFETRSGSAMIEGRPHDVLT